MLDGDPFNLRMSAESGEKCCWPNLRGIIFFLLWSRHLARTSLLTWNLDLTHANWSQTTLHQIFIQWNFRSPPLGNPHLTGGLPETEHPTWKKFHQAAVGRHATDATVPRQQKDGRSGHALSDLLAALSSVREISWCIRPRCRWIDPKKPIKS